MYPTHGARKAMLGTSGVGCLVQQHRKVFVARRLDYMTAGVHCVLKLRARGHRDGVRSDGVVRAIAWRVSNGHPHFFDQLFHLRAHCPHRLRLCRG